MSTRPTAWPGLVVSLACLAAMLVVAWAVWPALPEVITTREPAAARAGVRVPRAVLAAVVPATLLGVAGVLVAIARAAATVALVLLAPFLLVLHAALLLHTAGYAIPLEHVMAVALGLLLTGLGVALPRLKPPSFTWSLTGEWQRAQGPGGIALMVLGAACAGISFLLPPMPVAVVSAALVGAAYLGTVLLSLVRVR